MVLKILTFKILFIIFIFNCNNLNAQTITGGARVIDGDTIHVGKNKIRLYGIDAPEKKQLCDFNKIKWSCGIQSSKALKNIIEDKNIKCQIKDIDKYERFIAICFVDKVNINKLMVKNGWAIAYRYFSLEYIDEEENARIKKLGIWKGNFQIPYQYRKSKKKY